MKGKTRDLEESLTVNQDLFEDRLNTLKSQLRIVQKEMSEKKAELKEQLRIQWGRLTRNNLRVDGIKEDTANKLRSFLYDELEITGELYIERAHRVRRRGVVKASSNNIPSTIADKLLDSKKRKK